MYHPTPDVFRLLISLPTNLVGRYAVFFLCRLATAFACLMCIIAWSRSFARVNPALSEETRGRHYLVFERHERLDALDEAEAGGIVKAFPTCAENC